jgi:hypothetical protein
MGFPRTITQALDVFLASKTSNTATIALEADDEKTNVARLEEVKLQEEVIQVKKKFEIDTKNITRAAPLMGYKEQK